MTFEKITGDFAKTRSAFLAAAEKLLAAVLSADLQKLDPDIRAGAMNQVQGLEMGAIFMKQIALAIVAREEMLRECEADAKKKSPMDLN